MSEIERPWLANYPKGVPATIDPDSYASINEVLERAISKHRDRDSFHCMGKTITYGEFDRLKKVAKSGLSGALVLVSAEPHAAPNLIGGPTVHLGGA